MTTYLYKTAAWRGGHTVKIDAQQAFEIWNMAKADGLAVTVTQDGTIIEPGTEYERRILGYHPEEVKA